MSSLYAGAKILPSGVNKVNSDFESTYKKFSVYFYYIIHIIVIWNSKK